MKSIKTSLKLTAIAVAICGINQTGYAQIGLGKLKDKVKTKTESGSNNSSSVPEVNTAGKSADDIQREYWKMADDAMDQKKYADAKALYQKAEDADPTSSAAKRGDFKSGISNADAYINNYKENAKVASETDALQNKLAGMQYKIDPVEDNGMSNEFHKGNVKKIVFSKSEIGKTTSSSSAFANSFTLGENIYSRVYLDKSMTNEAYSIGTYPTNNFRYRITVSGKTFNSLYNNSNILVPGEEEVYSKWTTFQLALSPKPEDVLVIQQQN